VGYPGLAISRTPKREFRNRLEQEIEHLWMAEKSGEPFIPPELKEIQGKIETLTRPTAIFMDRLDYLMSKTNFEEVLSFVQSLREIAYLKGHVVILSVDPFTLGKREYRLIEKEALTVEPLYKTKLPEELIDVLKVVYQHNLKGVNPSYTKVGQEIGVSKPTARRRIRTLVGYGYLEESKRGRTKTVELTEKGRALFMR
jgi:DNA-binding MarR family transcriptional regulator